MAAVQYIKYIAVIIILVPDNTGAPQVNCSHIPKFLIYGPVQAV